MKILKGKVKIGTYNNINVLLDWTYLTQERGLRKEQDIFELILGRFIALVSAAVLLFLFIYDISLGNFLLFDAFKVDNLIEMLFWVCIGGFMYSAYLNRDRTEFFDTLDLQALTSLREQIRQGKKFDSIEIMDFVDFDVLYILDDLIIQKDENIYTYLMTNLIKMEDVKKLLERVGVDNSILQRKLVAYNVESTGDKTYQINKLLYQSFVLADKYGFSFIGEWVLFLKLALDEFKPLFLELGVKEDILMSVLEWSKTQAISNRYKKVWKHKSSLKPKGLMNRSYTAVATPTLNSMATDLTKAVVNDGFTYAMSREKEIDEVLRNLRQSGRSIVLLIGEPGVGKTTLLKSIAVRMVVEDVPDEIKDMRLVEFDFSKLFARYKNIAEIRNNIDLIFEEIERAKNIVLVIDDFDELINIREELSAEILAALTRTLERAKVRVIASSSQTGYSRSIKPNSALANMFDIVRINEPSPNIALQILFDERHKIEKKYGIKLQFDALYQAIELSVRYDTTRLLPFKAIDLLEDACVYALENGLKFVSGKEIEAIVSKDTGMSVGRLDQDEQAKLINMEAIMHKRVIGQDKAIKAVADALRRMRAGLNVKNGPVASFLFFGPTGVGKTEVARTLADVYFGDEKLVTRLDMSEFQESENVNRLIGYRQGDDFIEGQLTGKVREHPFSLILLDEIEKANPKVLDLFLQVLDEGHITDGIGRRVDFKNTIIIATSNIASAQIAKNIEQGMSYEDTNRLAQEEVKKHLRIEFLNRFDKVIMFKPLNKVEIEKVCELMMQKVVNKLMDQGIELKYEATLISELVNKGYSPVFGAREMNRVIQDEVENRVADLIVAGKVRSGSTIIIYNLKHITTNA